MAGIESQAPAAPAAAGLVAACGAPPILQNPPTAEETRVAFDSADPEQLYVFDGASLPIEQQAKSYTSVIAMSPRSPRSTWAMA